MNDLLVISLISLFVLTIPSILVAGPSAHKLKKKLRKKPLEVYKIEQWCSDPNMFWAHTNHGRVLIEPNQTYGFTNYDIYIFNNRGWSIAHPFLSRKLNKIFKPHLDEYNGIS